MITVRLHAQAGKVWALFQCSVCREVQKRPLRDALTAPLACKRCGITLDISEAVAEAEQRNACSGAIKHQTSSAARSA